MVIMINIHIILPFYLETFVLTVFTRGGILFQVHAYIIAQLKKDMPSMFGKDSKKKELIARLPDIFAQLQREHQISPGDFPNCKRMQEQLQHQDFTKFHQVCLI